MKAYHFQSLQSRLRQIQPCSTFRHTDQYHPVYNIRTHTTYLHPDTSHGLHVQQALPRGQRAWREQHENGSS
jgi:hypothetical protein